MNPRIDETERQDEAHVILRASAGSGKTFQLSSRYLARLRTTGPDRILATTFTRKAAGEILERILLRLADSADDPDKRLELSRSVGGPPLGREQCLSLLSLLTRQLHRVRVSTLDSFFSRAAGAFTLELGLPPGWRILDEVADSELRARAVERVLHEGAKQDVIQLVHLLAKGDAKRSVTGLIRNTVDSLYGVFASAPAEAWGPLPRPALLAADVLAGAVQRLREVPLPQHARWRKDRDAAVDAAERNAWEEFVSGGIAVRVLAGEHHYCGKEIPREVAAAYAPLLQQAAAVLINQLNEQHRATLDLLTRFDAVYGRLKREARGLCFDDVTRGLAEGLSGGRARALAYRLDSQIDHLLLDEFQDTSLTQWQVLQPIAESVVKGRETTFFCVGDGKQAIYGWRGGEAEIFDTIERQLRVSPRPPLVTSYRSSPVIIDTVNRIFGNLTSHPDLKGDAEAVRQWQAQFALHDTARCERPGYVRLETACVPDEGEEQKVATLRFTAARVAGIAASLPEGATVGVLTRTNDAVGRLIQELRGRGVPASEEGGNRLTDAAGVQLVLSLLKLADHPGDTIARYHVANSPLGAAVELARHDDAAAAEAAAEGVRRALLENGYGATLYEWALLLTPLCNDRELGRLRQLVLLGDAYEPLATLRPGDFVRYAEAQRVEDPRPAPVRVMTVHQAKGLEFDVVVLPELDGRFIPRPPEFVTGGDDPSARPQRLCRYRSEAVRLLLPADVQAAFRQTRDRTIREALCVLYVAVTRPIHALHMIVAPGNENEKSLPATPAGLLRASLAPQRPATAQTVLYQAGAADWHAPSGAKQRAAADAEPAREPLQVALAPLTGGRRRGRELIAPSRLKRRGPVALRRAGRAAASGGMERGTLLHAWCERLEWLDDGIPADADLRAVARRLDLAHVNIEDALRDFRRQLTAPAIAEVLSRRAYRGPLGLPWPAEVVSELAAGPVELRVRRELAVAVPDGNDLLSGSIDRLVLLSRGEKVLAADVLDFKTDAIDADDLFALPEKIELYREQIRAYVRATATIYSLSLERVSARLILLSAGRVETVRV